MTIGSDNIHFEQERLYIHAFEPMDWPAREFSRIPVFVQGRKYYVRSVRDGNPPYAMVYELWPWPADLHEESTREVIYDEAYVLERDKLAAKGRGYHRLHVVIAPLYPLLGLCWSRFKYGILVRLGFEPHSITGASIFLIFLLAVMAGVFGIIGGGLPMYFLMVLLGVDSLMRYSQYIEQNVDAEHHWGFYEWLLGRKRKR